MNESNQTKQVLASACESVTTELATVDKPMEELDLPPVNEKANAVIQESDQARVADGGKAETAANLGGWLVPQIKINVLRLWQSALELGVEETELRALLGTYGCESRKELTAEQAPDFVGELSHFVNDALKRGRS